ncbi:MAG TPA: glycosyltransferase family 9 protein [Candidatus Omnitrophota bacterium]|nr:glycosyltransferase family 9 protein [Candidatus Omnitrophota bacterium]
MSSDAPRRIRLYRPQNQLGDLLLNVPAIRAIRDRYPEAHLTLIVGPQNAPAVLGQLWADEVRVLRGRGAWAAVREALRIAPRPDLSVYFTTVSYSVSGALLAARSGARRRIGFVPARYGRRDWAGLTRAVPYPEGKLHQSEVSMALARAAGATVAPPPPHYVPDRRLLSRAPSGVAYLHPGAGKIKNRWPVERFAEVAVALARRGLDVHVLEGPQDSGTAAALSARVGHELPVVRGETVPALAARFARAALYVGNDTGPLHLAGAVGCPTVGVYGWTDPDEWKPVGARVRTVRASDATLESVTVAMVLEAVTATLEEGVRV